MAGENTVAAVGAAALLPNTEISMPSVIKKNSSVDIYKQYTVKYFIGPLDEPDRVLELEELETRALNPVETGIVFLESQRFIFAERMFVMVKYLKKRVR